MITIQSIRDAVLAPNPYTEMHHLVRKEMEAGRKVKEIFDSINPLVEEALDTPGLTEDGEESLLGTLDALTGNCHRDCQYRDPPNLTLPSEEEIAKLPRWARVAFAARCARRVLPLFKHDWPHAPEHTYGTLENDVQLSELSAQHAKAPTRNADLDTVVTAVEAQIIGKPVARTVARCAARAVESAQDACSDYNFMPGERPQSAAVDANEAAELISVGITTHIRRDFDHLAKLAEWRHWTDDTPVPPEVFGPLWPEGPPKGWPADPDLPQRADLPLELLSRAKVLEVMTEDETVNLFNHINAYYIARTGTRLTMEEFRPLIAAAVLAEV